MKDNRGSREVSLTEWTELYREYLWLPYVFRACTVEFLIIRKPYYFVHLPFPASQEIQSGPTPIRADRVR